MLKYKITSLNDLKSLKNRLLHEDIDYLDHYFDNCSDLNSFKYKLSLYKNGMFELIGNTLYLEIYNEKLKLKLLNEGFKETSKKIPLTKSFDFIEYSSIEYMNYKEKRLK